MLVSQTSFSEQEALYNAAFYQRLLTSLGIPAGARITVEPFCSTNDFGVSSGNDAYFDIGNPQLGNIAIGSQVSKVFYHGSLFVTYYCSSFASQATAASLWLAIGPNSGLAHWLFDQRSDPSVATIISKNSNQHKFDSIGFNYLRMNVNGGVSIYTAETLFVGRKITY
jgi:hypothetical protein